MIQSYLLEQKNNKDLTIPVDVNTTTSGKIIFYCHGFSSDKDGHKYRHEQIGNLLEKENAASLVRFTESRLWKKKNNKELLIQTHSQDLQQVIDFILKRSKEICGSEKPELYLAGFSAGGGVCMNMCDAYKFKKILLLAPAYQTEKDLERMLPKIKKFTGEVLLVHGIDDEVEPVETSEMLYQTLQTKKELQKIPDCDHGFLNEKNNSIFINSFLQVFKKKSQ